ncbi:enoyl-CoA hydratase/isomerase family protein [Caulobacter mirabilis]|uniref:Enoyl-CoA hydratase n=1 Tax=Caulobacter mirabilis TaxID=69666 RepID=A0A2D2B0S3_9CAUL|nr:enoyl-CoA hydratase/isomerase family protein [Caulobacter mirabilis]ATQ43850.1 enoyl-CoA hydratase [Caulobacter mirabilis]
MKAAYGEVTAAVDGHVAVLEIDRPPNNHVTVGLIRDLADALDAVDADPDLRVSVLCTAGKVFCGGADLVTPAGEGIVDSTQDLYAQAARLFSTRKPIVAVVQGSAVGAGLGLALAADFRVAAPEARFSANFVKLGFHPGFGLTASLPRVVGPRIAELMFLTGRRVPGEQALAWGLVDELVPLDRLRETALTLARELAENAPLAVQATRATLRGDLADAVRRATAHEAAEQAKLRNTTDFAEGVRAVAERRPGRFTGR